MKNLYFFLVILISCGTTKPPTPIPPTPHPIPEPVVYDTIHHTTYLQDTAHQVLGEVSVLDFGAHAGAGFDNSTAFDNAISYVITHPATLTIPIGDFFISRPWLWQNVTGGANQFFTVHLKGTLSNKSSSNEYLSKIICNYKSGYGIGIELGRSIKIENLTILGQYTFWNTVSNQNIATLKFSDWVDPTISDSRYAPYAGISIDPNPLLQGGQGGTSDVTINNCSVRQWMVGICLTPNGVTANDEMINLIDDDVEACRVAIAVCQDQSKEIHIDRFKCWSSTHTILDGVTYGNGIGGGSVMIDGMNIAGNVNQLFNIINDRFPLSATNIYSESIFRIGRVGGKAGANIIGAEIDFLSAAGWPEADYLICGSANFYGGCIRYYDNSPTHRLNFVNTGSMFRDMTLSNTPIVKGLYGMPGNVYPEPRYDNVIKYVGGMVTAGQDTLILLPHQPYSISIDRVKWTATVGGMPGLVVGDYIIGAPNGTAYDPVLNPNRCPTYQIGRVVSINGSTASLDCVGLNVYSNSLYDNIYISRLK